MIVYNPPHLKYTMLVAGYIQSLGSHRLAMAMDYLDKQMDVVQSFSVLFCNQNSGTLSQLTTATCSHSGDCKTALNDMVLQSNGNAVIPTK